jgi:hypothetical protein
MAKIALASVDDLLSRTNALDVGEIRPLLYECLVSATIQLRTILRFGSWDAATGVVEEFFINRDQSKRIANNRFMSFRVNNGFIDESTTPVALRYGLSPDELDNAADLDAQFITVDAEAGLVKFDTYGFQDSFISVYRRRIPSDYFQYLFRITYDHGLLKKTTDEGKVYKDVPDWLTEACLIKAREIYQLTNPAIDVKAKDYSGNLAYLIDDKVRLVQLNIESMQ